MWAQISDFLCKQMERWNSLCGLVISLSQTLQKSRQMEVRWWIIQTSSNSALLTGSEICSENPGERKNSGGCGVWQFQQMSYTRAVKAWGQSHPKVFVEWRQWGPWGSHLHCSLGQRALGNAPHDSHLGHLMTPSHLSLCVMQSFLLPLLPLLEFTI